MLTTDESHPLAAAVAETVTAVFVDVSDEGTLAVHAQDGQVLGLTPRHEVWTFQRGWIAAGELAVGDCFRDAAGRPVDVLAIEHDPTPAPVYNLEVGGTWTYYAEGLWVHNNSCDALWHQNKWNKLAGEAYQDWVLRLNGLSRNRNRLPSGHIPDIWDPATKAIGDVKDVKNIGMTPQLQAIADYASQNGYPKPTLIVSGNNETISEAVRRAFEIVGGP